MLEARNISFSYTDKTVIDNASFAISKGRQVSVVGESGCGKSTLLKLIYGLYNLDKGSISYNGEPILGPKFNLIPGADYIKYLAQDFGLMPYITVAENVGSFLSNAHKEKKQERVRELLEMVEMTDFANVKAQYLSGGQQQRAALAKVLALEPEVLLLDEPFSQIDAFRANSLRRNLFRYFKEKEMTCIIATHDSIDVLSFSDETIVMRNGRILAIENPKILYDHPKDKYIASLFGDVNEIPGHFLKASPDKKKTILVYPHQLAVVPNSALMVTVKKSYFTGNGFLLEGIYEKGNIYFNSQMPLPGGTLVYLALASRKSNQP